MEQNAILDNPSVSTLPYWKVLAGTMVVASGLIFGGSAAVEKYEHYKASKAVPLHNNYSEQISKSSYYVMAAHLSSNITGEAVLDLDNFKVPVKFVFDSKVQYSGTTPETVIDIKSLEIGIITNMSGDREYSDFTNFEDHQAINAAITAYKFAGGCVMSTQYTTPFREYITRDELGRYHVRLGPQVFSTNWKLTDIRIEGENGGVPVTEDLLKAKPWILRNLRQEVGNQRKKERDEMFSKDCFKRTPYSKNQKIAYKNSRYNG